MNKYDDINKRLRNSLSRLKELNIKQEEYMKKHDGKKSEKISNDIEIEKRKFNIYLEKKDYVTDSYFKGKMNPLTESILDPINKTRCREIFNEDDIMKPEVVIFIEDSFKLWMDQLNPDLRIFKVKGFKCIGSSTGFQYTDTSDLDVQVFVEMKDDHNFDEIWQLVKILPNGHNIPGTHHPVNYFFIDENNPTSENKYENLYNINTKEWEKKTASSKQDIPVLYVREISRFFTDAFDLLIGRYTRDMQYLKDVLNIDSSKQDISEKERKEAVDKCLTQVRADVDSMRLADKLIHGFRLQAYDDNNFFHISINYTDDTDPRKSMNEAIYKTLDKFEYREKLRGFINEAQEFLDKVSPTGDGDNTNDDENK